MFELPSCTLTLRQAVRYVTNGLDLRGGALSIHRGAAFKRTVDDRPSRETWFCFYQRDPGRTAYLYEYDIPITEEVYRQQLGPELRHHFARPARECYIHSVDGESFRNCDLDAAPWYCYRLELRGQRVGQRFGPYAADDIVSPNKVLLPQQQRWRNNVRDVRDIVELLAEPTAARLAANLRKLMRVAVEDGWTSGPQRVHTLMAQRWGHEVLRRYGITPAVVAGQFRAMQQAGLAEAEEDGVGGGEDGGGGGGGGEEGGGAGVVTGPSGSAEAEAAALASGGGGGGGAGSGTGGAGGQAAAAAGVEGGTAPSPTPKYATSNGTG